MKIGIALFAINPEKAGGVTTYALSLLRGFESVGDANDYYLLANKDNAAFFENVFQKPNFTTVVARDSGKECSAWRTFLRVLQNRIFTLPPLRRLYRRINTMAHKETVHIINGLNLDVLYTPATTIDPFGADVPQVVSMHDIQHVHFPRFFTLAEKMRRKTVYHETARQAVHIQASSEYMREDFIRHFKCPKTKIVLIRDGIDGAFKNYEPNEMALTAVREKYNLPERFIFYPAQHWIHKNHITLVRALHLVRKEHKTNIPLVLTGNKKHGSERFYDKVEPEDEVLFLGNVPFEDLPHLYKLATIMCVPSLHESNSLPALEALAIGTPVVASDIEPNIELNENNAITIFEKMNPADLEKKLLALWDDEELRKKKILLGRSLAEQYSWGKTALAYIQLFKKAARQKHD